MDKIDETKKVVIWDFDYPPLLENKIFDPVLAEKVSHTISPVCYLYKHLEHQRLCIQI